MGLFLYLKKLSKSTIKDNSNILLALHVNERAVVENPKLYFRISFLNVHKVFLSLVAALTLGISIANFLNSNINYC